MRAIGFGVLVLLVFYGLVLQIQAIWPFTIDDMYITLRYARQWVLHDTLSWNIAEAPVEGYSNFSYLLIARFCETLHLNTVFVLKALGVLSLVLLCVGLCVITAHWVEAEYAVIPMLWLLAYRGEIEWTVSGLETTFYQCLLVFGVYALLKSVQYQRQKIGRIAGLLLAAVGLTRPEGGIVALCLILILTAYTVHDKAIRPVWVNVVIVFTLCYMPYFTWRIWYFGYVFPNSVYCKAVSADHIGLLDKQYLHLMWPFFCCALPLLKPHLHLRGYAFLWMPTLLYGALCWAADPIVAFDNRLFLPAIALFFPLSVMGLRRLISQQSFIYLVSIILLCLCIPKLSLDGYRSFVTNPIAGQKLRQEVSSWLAKNALRTQKIVLADSGLIPYEHPELTFIDSYCLNNVVLGHCLSKDRYLQFCEQMIQQQPDYIILTAAVQHGQAIYTPGDACLSKYLSGNGNYQLVNLFRAYHREQEAYQYVLYKKLHFEHSSV